MNTLDELAARVVQVEKRMAELEAKCLQDQPEKKKDGNSKPLTIKEFILSKRPSNDVERTLAIAYFLERFVGLTSFNIDDLSHHFQLAKESIPGNINDKVNLNIKKGHLAEAREKKDKKKAWIVTNSG